MAICFHAVDFCKTSNVDKDIFVHTLMFAQCHHFYVDVSYSIFACMANNFGNNVWAADEHYFCAKINSLKLLGAQKAQILL